MSGRLRAFGLLNAGAGAPAVVIPPVAIPTEDDAVITGFGAAVMDAGGSTNTDSRYLLEVSSDGFAADVRAYSSIQIVQGGTVLLSFSQDDGVRVSGGDSFRVRAVQAVATVLSAEVHGVTRVNDISASTTV